MLIPVLAFFWFLVCSVEGASIHGCVVEEHTQGIITCEVYNATETMWWYYYQSFATTQCIISTCNSTTKTCPFTNAFITSVSSLQYVSNTSTVLTFERSFTARPQAQINTTIYCSIDTSCLLDIVVNAVLGNMDVFPPTTPADKPFVVKVIVRIINVFSSLNNYTAVWSRQYGTEQYQVIDRKALFQESNPSNLNRSCSCEHSLYLPYVDGNYTYRVAVYPGGAVMTGDTIVVMAPPGPPSITCSPGGRYVVANTALTCYCSGAVGQPPGRLELVMRDANDVDTTLKTGNAGDTALQLTWVVNRSHDAITLRCDLDWYPDALIGPPHFINVEFSEINDCSSSRCENGGKCVDQVNFYTCNCAAGYTGNLCHTVSSEDSQLGLGIGVGVAGMLLLLAAALLFLLCRKTKSNSSLTDTNGDSADTREHAGIQVQDSLNSQDEETSEESPSGTQDEGTTAMEERGFGEGSSVDPQDFPNDNLQGATPPQSPQASQQSDN